MRGLFGPDFGALASLRVSRGRTGSGSHPSRPDRQGPIATRLPPAALTSRGRLARQRPGRPTRPPPPSPASLRPPPTAGPRPGGPTAGIAARPLREAPQGSAEPSKSGGGRHSSLAASCAASLPGPPAPRLAPAPAGACREPRRAHPRVATTTCVARLGWGPSAHCRPGLGRGVEAVPAPLRPGRSSRITAVVAVAAAPHMSGGAARLAAPCLRAGPADPIAGPARLCCTPRWGRGRSGDAAVGCESRPSRSGFTKIACSCGEDLFEGGSGQGSGHGSGHGPDLAATGQFAAPEAG